jgi:NitT/TauT family transport system ATP-binding protein
VLKAIPHVPPGQILGLLSILEDASPGSSVYTLSNAIGREFGEIISLVTAAEVLGFVETPGNEVRLTELGVRFLAAHRKDRRVLFGQQIRKLGVFREVIGLLEEKGAISEPEVIAHLSAALPYENPQRLLHTMVAWGRYAGLLDYELAGKRIRLFPPAEANNGPS